MQTCRIVISWRKNLRESIYPWEWNGAGDIMMIFYSRKSRRILQNQFDSKNDVIKTDLITDCQTFLMAWILSLQALISWKNYVFPIICKCVRTKIKPGSQILRMTIISTMAAVSTGKEWRDCLRKMEDYTIKSSESKFHGKIYQFVLVSEHVDLFFILKMIWSSKKKGK